MQLNDHLKSACYHYSKVHLVYFKTESEDIVTKYAISFALR